MCEKKKILIVKNESMVILKLVEIIQEISDKCLKNQPYFTIGLSGGSLVKYLCEGLPKLKTDWSKWIFLLCDERVVDDNHNDSTYGTYKNTLFKQIQIQLSSQFIKIKQNLSVEETAKEYQHQLEERFGSNVLPSFDLLLLGMGPDGHTCSLFPNHSVLNETELWVAGVHDSPKPPPNRITLTYPVINNAKYLIFACAGQSKAEMVQKILKDKEDLPAARVQPKNGELIWILDEAAAKNIN